MNDITVSYVRCFQTTKIQFIHYIFQTFWISLLSFEEINLEFIYEICVIEFYAAIAAVVDVQNDYIHILCN